MATVFISDQYTGVLAKPIVFANTNAFAGRIRIAACTITLPSSGLATGDTIRLFKLPNGARLINGDFAWSATQGATATTAIGTSASSGAYFAAAVTSSAALFPILATQALGYLSTLSADTEVIATNAAAAWTASSVFMCRINYVVD